MSKFKHIPNNEELKKQLEEKVDKSYIESFKTNIIIITVLLTIFAMTTIGFLVSIKFDLLKLKAIEGEIILSNEVSEYKIREMAVKNGMLTMAEDGLLKAIKGVTSVDEVFRVTK